MIYTVLQGSPRELVVDVAVLLCHYVTFAGCCALIASGVV